MSTDTLPRYAHRRGTRGFAAFVTCLAGFVVLGVGAVVLPTTALGSLALSWLVPLTVAFGIAHFVAAYGLIRRRAWSAALTGYLAAIGLGVAIYGLMLALTGADPFGATSSLPSDRAWAQGVGLLVWMIGLWVVAARFAWKAVRPLDVDGGSTAGAPRTERGRRGLIASILGPWPRTSRPSTTEPAGRPSSRRSSAGSMTASPTIRSFARSTRSPTLPARGTA